MPPSLSSLGPGAKNRAPLGGLGAAPGRAEAPLSVPCAAPSSAGPGRRLSLRQAASWRLPSASLPRCCWEEGGSAAAAGAGGGGTAPSWGSASRFVPFQGPGDWCQGLSTSPHGEGDASSLSVFPLPLDPALLHSPAQGLLLPVFAPAESSPQPRQLAERRTSTPVAPAGCPKVGSGGHRDRSKTWAGCRARPLCPAWPPASQPPPVAVLGASTEQWQF